MRIFITPTWKSEDRGDGGIRRVVDAQLRYLPEFGIGVTDDPRAADLVAVHGAARVDVPGVPLICHSHGAMWEDYQFGDWGDKVNQQLVESMIRADAITAPSRWVAHAISRGMLVSPTVIYHGVDADEWAHTDDHLGYVLWNKARTDPVSDPADMQQLAALMPDVKFISTFGQQTRNLWVTGLGSYEQMKPIVQKAGLYLATARETMGIGTLEALAAGVPIVGWDYGGQSEIVIDGQTGYLAPFGDMAALMDCVRRALAERERLSTNAIEDARARWGWRDKIAQYAALYQAVVERHQQPRPKVSVIITSYNLAQYLGEALTSVAEQTLSDWECIIVDDCSTDDTAAMAKLWTTDQQIPMYEDDSRVITRPDPRFRYLRTPHNLGLSGARNYGWQHAHGHYIQFLDADDMLEHNALATLSHALDRDPAIHIAYGSLDTMSHDGGNRQRNPWPRGNFVWQGQIAHLNQLPYAAMMRREVLERSGGYRARDWRAEDASFWMRVTSFGFRAAKVTEDTTLIYRMHDAQKSRAEAREHADRDGDWTAWLPWRLAGSGEEGLEAMRRGVQPNARIVPFGAQGTPPSHIRAWPVRHFQHPVVSVIIPVGPGHAQFLVDALDSVQAQTMVEWECIVVNDTGGALDLTPWPWARQAYTGEFHPSAGTRWSAGGHGAGAARNRGLMEARAPFVLFLDADDVLLPTALEQLLRGHIDSGGRYVYSDVLTLDNPTRIDGPQTAQPSPEYDERRMLRQLFHAVTTLLPTAWARDVLFDEKLPVFEDWDFYARCAVKGYHGHRVAEPLLIYRGAFGQRTRTAVAKVVGDTPHYTPLGEQTVAAIADRLAPYTSGEEQIMGCCGSGPLAVASSALADMVDFATGGAPLLIDAGAQTVRLEYIGEKWGAESYIGARSGRVYRFGRDPHDRYADVEAGDVEFLLIKRNEGNEPEFRIVTQAPAIEDETDAPAAPKVRGRGRKVA